MIYEKILTPFVSQEEEAPPEEEKPEEEKPEEEETVE